MYGGVGGEDERSSPYPDFPENAVTFGAALSVTCVPDPPAVSLGLFLQTR